MQKDRATVEQLVTEDHMSITGRKRTYNRNDIGAQVNQMDIHQYQVSNQQCRNLSDQKVLIHFETRINASSNGRNENGNFAVVSVWVQENGGWQESFYQETRIGD